MKPRTRLLNLLTLAVLATLMAELLNGSTPVSRISQLLPQVLMYGSGAILIRGVVRRLDLGWIAVMLLGLAYGIFEEGLVLQSMFNAHFLGLDISFGRLGGVNWIWTEFLTGFHCFWSMTGAILVAELVFYKERQQPWVSRTGLWVSGAMLVSMGLALHFLFIKLSQFNAPPLAAAGCLATIAVLVMAALKMPRQTPAIQSDSSTLSLLAILLITLAAGIGWLLGIHTIFNPQEVPVWVPWFGGPLLVAAYFTLLTQWKVVQIASTMDRLALAGGLLAAELVLGYANTRTNQVDHDGQLAIIAVTVIFLLVLWKRLSKKESSLAT